MRLIQLRKAHCLCTFITRARQVANVPFNMTIRNFGNLAVKIPKYDIIDAALGS